MIRRARRNHRREPRARRVERRRRRCALHDTMRARRNRLVAARARRVACGVVTEGRRPSRSRRRSAAPRRSAGQRAEKGDRSLLPNGSRVRPDTRHDVMLRALARRSLCLGGSSRQRVRDTARRRSAGDDNALGRRRSRRETHTTLCRARSVPSVVPSLPSLPCLSYRALLTSGCAARICSYRASARGRSPPRRRHDAIVSGHLGAVGSCAASCSKSSAAWTERFRARPSRQLHLSCSQGRSILT